MDTGFTFDSLRKSGDSTSSFWDTADNDLLSKGFKSAAISAANYQEAKKDIPDVSLGSLDRGKYGLGMDNSPSLKASKGTASVNPAEFERYWYDRASKYRTMSQLGGK